MAILAATACGGGIGAGAAAAGAAGAGAGAAGAGLAAWAKPAVVIAPAARAETSTSLEIMCSVVLLEDPSGSSLFVESGDLPILILQPLTQNRACHPKPPLMRVSGTENRREREGCQNSIDYIGRFAAWSNLSPKIGSAASSLSCFLGVVGLRLQKSSIWRGVSEAMFGMQIALSQIAGNVAFLTGTQEPITQAREMHPQADAHRGSDSASARTAIREAFDGPFCKSRSP